MARKKASNDSAALSKLARTALEKHRLDEAHRAASRALVLDRGNAEALAVLLSVRSKSLAPTPVTDIPAKVIPYDPKLFDRPIPVDEPEPVVPDPADANYYSISAGDLCPSWGPGLGGIQGSFAPWYIHGSSARFGMLDDGGPMFGGLHLPHGSRIWGWRAYAYGDSSANHETTVGVCIREYGPLTNSHVWIGGERTATFTPGTTTLLRELRVDSLDHLVDNREHTYYIEVTFGGSGERRSSFRGAIVIYH